ncbi:MAG TPA: nucleotidyl transferase AbiEii/AbiGii toxin family protein [Candidatus Polarisedimenticolaceae bacterium]|nr:nucleotidyl transferase AbiEii/AbiGii toxin family protein [Candidatus Polarisedimenticolaceae bacterium]
MRSRGRSRGKERREVPEPETEEIRRIALVAVFSDDEIMNRVVLKGGNALTLVYNIGGRTSVDLDFSIEGDFEDVSGLQGRLFAALTARFEAAGYHAFDMTLEPRPRNPSADRLEGRWGGYQATFKVIRIRDAVRLGWRLQDLQRQAVALSPNQVRTFRIDFSKYEFVGEKLERDIDEFRIYVYSPAMLVVEKLRALCQQSPAYELNTTPSPRGRDCYDIYQIMQALGVNLRDPETIDLLRYSFDAKAVPLVLLRDIQTQREFHRADWQSVRAAVAGEPEEFDFYFDFVLDRVLELEALGVVDAPR